MNDSTDRDYADIVDPFVQAETEAFKRGYGQGILTGIFYAILCGLIGGALLLVSTRGLAAEPVRYKLTVTPIRASAVDARFTICQQYREFYGRWQCHAIR